MSGEFALCVACYIPELAIFWTGHCICHMLFCMSQWLVFLLFAAFSTDTVQHDCLSPASHLITVNEHSVIYLYLALYLTKTLLDFWATVTIYGQVYKKLY